MQNHDIVAQWLQFAEDDLRTAKYLLGLYPRPLEFFMPGGETEVSFCSIISRGKPKKTPLREIDKAKRGFADFVERGPDDE